MKTDKITVYNIFEPQRRYLVPIFQRGYVWTKALQWEPLWQDLIEQSELVQSRKGLAKNSLRKHFLGAMVLSQVPTVIRQVPSSEVIDGQQRLLTLQVLLTALRDSVRDLNDEYLNTTLDRLTKNPPPINHSDEQHKVWPTAAYQTDLRNLCTAMSPEMLSRLYPQKMKRGKLIPPLPALVDAYFYFSSMIKGFLSPQMTEEALSSSESANDQVKDRAYLLFETICQYVQLVEIQLEAEDDPQVIFETLNARGIPLEPSDLIRNFIFLTAQRQDKDVNVLYDRWWKDFDEANSATGKFWKEKERQGRFFRSRLDLFFFHYMTQKTQGEIKMAHVYQEFKEWWENTHPGMETELGSIQAASHTFQQLLGFDDTTRLGVFAQRLKLLDTTTTYPLVLWLCENRRKIGETEFDGILQDIESYLVRRAVCRLTPKGYNHIFMNLLIKLNSAPVPNRAVVRDELLSLEGDSAEWPDDEAFKRALLYGALYFDIGPKKVRLLLTAIELASRSPKQESLTLPINNWLTIEHVMPQGLNPDEWPYSTSAMLRESPAFSRLSDLHSLGNLTLLTQPLNSGVSNGPFRLKRPEIAGQSLLVLNSYFQGFKDSDQWDEETILERGKKLADKAIKIWPRP